LAELLNLNRLAYFTTVMETGSFTAAADRLGVAKAVVSHQIGKLEEELGATLLQRTTRRVTPTEEGRLFYDRAMIILREAEAAYGEISRGGVEPSGTLRLTAPLDYGTKMVAPVMAAYLRTYPHMRVDAIFDDAVSNLVDEQIDLGIRVGWLTDSSNQARRLGTIRQTVVASPGFAASLPPDVTPRQARSLAWVGNAQLRGIACFPASAGCVPGLQRQRRYRRRAAGAGVCRLEPAIRRHPRGLSTGPVPARQGARLRRSARSRQEEAITRCCPGLKPVVISGPLAGSSRLPSPRS
jgi:DNA-binding transcriptional LysR family regulator